MDKKSEREELMGAYQRLVNCIATREEARVALEKAKRDFTFYEGQHSEALSSFRELVTKIDPKIRIPEPQGVAVTEDSREC